MRAKLLFVLFFLLPSRVTRAYIRRKYARLLADPHIPYAAKLDIGREVQALRDFEQCEARGFEQ